MRYLKPPITFIVSYVLSLKKQQWFELALIINSALAAFWVISLFLDIGPSLKNTELTKHKVFANRNFKQSPFTLMDAHTACRYGAEQTHKKQLLRAHMDDHSTRYDPVKGLYFVVLVADIGTRREYTQTYIYCSVNPRSYQITSYQEASEKGKKDLKRAFNLFD